MDLVLHPSPQSTIANPQSKMGGSTIHNGFLLPLSPRSKSRIGANSRGPEAWREAKRIEQLNSVNGPFPPRNGFKTRSYGVRKQHPPEERKPIIQKSY